MKRKGIILDDDPDLLDQLIGGEAEIKEMRETELGEISVVDAPATGRRFVMFKRGAKGDSFPGLGSDAPGGTSSLLDLARFLEANPTMGPAAAEAAEAGDAGISAALVDDYGGAGDEATVSDPATAGDFVPAKHRILTRLEAKGIKGPLVEACVAAMLEDPEFTAGAEDPEAQAFAVCSEEHGDKGGPGPMRKQDEIMMEERAVEAEVTEIPASPTPWPLTDCISEAGEIGLGEIDSVSVCQLIRTELGNPSNEGEILLPEGMTTGALIQAAAMSMNLAKPEGAGDGDAEVSAEPPLMDGELRAPMKFTGKNRWLRWLGNHLGLNKPKSRLDRIEEVGKVNAKSSAELARVTRDLIRVLAAQRGVDLATLEVGVAEPVEASAGPAGASVGEAAIAAVEAADGKAAKDEPTAVADPPAEETEAEELARLRAENTELREMTAPAAVEIEGGNELEILEPPGNHGPLGPPAGAEAPAAVAPVGDPMVVAPSMVEPAKRSKRLSQPPVRAAKAGGPEMSTSTFLGGAQVPRADREACGTLHPRR